MIAKHEAPTVRLPARLPSKPTGTHSRSLVRVISPQCVYWGKFPIALTYGVLLFHSIADPLFFSWVYLHFLAGGIGRYAETPTDDGDEPTDDGILDRTQVKILSLTTTKKAQKNNQKDEGKASN